MQCLCSRLIDLNFIHKFLDILLKHTPVISVCHFSGSAWNALEIKMCRYVIYIIYHTGAAVADRPVGIQQRSNQGQQRAPPPLRGGTHIHIQRHCPPTPMVLWNSRGHPTPVKLRYSKWSGRY